jgi:hypothetical protein
MQRLKFLPRYGKLVDKREMKTAEASMVASLPVLVKVAVPQLAMNIAVAQRKTFRETGVEFIGSEVADVAPTRIHVLRLAELGLIWVRAR